MYNLLVPIDGSKNAHRALKYAIGFAKKHKGAKLHIVSVHQKPMIYGDAQLYVSQELVEESQKRYSARILAAAAKMLKAARIPHTSESLVGDTASMIVKEAKKLRCNGIIMGTRGMGTVGNLLLGSVATKVVHLTKLPVTLVK